MGAADFFDKLEPFEDFLGITEERHFAPAPSGWHIAVTDIRGSTEAIEEGRYKDVNLIGAASIAGARNACGQARIPYCFGGDGAILLVPDEHLAAVQGALNELAWLARQLFGLELRAGTMAVAALRDEGFELRVGRYRVAPELDLAMFAGRGVNEAVRRLKDPVLGPQISVVSEEPPPMRASFKGLHCRWRPLKSRHGTMASILVAATATSPAEENATYRRVLENLRQLADDQIIKPIGEDNAILTDQLHDLDAEAALQTRAPGGLRYALYRRRTRLITGIGASLMRRGKRLGSFDGPAYRKSVTERSDYRKFDGMLRMVVNLTTEQLDALQAFLEQEYRAGSLRYGIHTSDAALMTCIVYDRQTDHVHFIDGADGGYAEAHRRLRELGRNR